MKKSLLFFIVMLQVFNMHAQIRTGSFKAVPVKQPKLKPANLLLKPDGALGACDTLKLDSSHNWTPFYYTAAINGTEEDGYAFGVSKDTAGFSLRQDANYYDVSANDYNYISGGLVYFAKANSNQNADLPKNINFNVYDDDGTGYPGTLLGSTSLTLANVKADVDSNLLSEFIFSTPIAIPANKIFYISVDHSNFKWDNSTHDSLAIVADSTDQAPAALYQYIKSYNTWIDVSSFYGLNLNLFLFPYVSNSPDGCGVLPVSIFNFSGSIKDNQAYLNWSTATESNNKGFYVERSKDGRNFTDIGFVNGAINSSKIINYNYTDISLKDINVTTTYYRLKQVDLDGKFTYSKVLSLNLNNVSALRLYPNPVKDMATVELNLETSSKVTVQVISRDGRIVITSDKGIVNAGTQQVFIDTKNLANGSYIVRTTIGDKTYSQLLVKE